MNDVLDYSKIQLPVHYDLQLCWFSPGNGLECILVADLLLANITNTVCQVVPFYFNERFRKSGMRQPAPGLVSWLVCTAKQHHFELLAVALKILC